MLAVIFAFVALVGWAFGDLFTTIASRKIGSYNASFYGYLFGLLVMTTYTPFALNEIANLNSGVIILTIILSLFEIGGFIAYNEALKIGNSSLVGTISGAFTSLVVILALIFLGEKLLPIQLAAIVVIFIGLLLSSLNFYDLKNKKGIVNKSTALSFVAMVSWAIYFTFIKIPIQESGFFWPSYITLFTGAVLLFVFGLKRIKKPTQGLKNGMPAAFLAGTLLSIGSIGYDIGISKGLSAVVAPIAGAYPALFALLAFFIFKDSITKQQKLGMVVTLVGIIFLAYLSK